MGNGSHIRAVGDEAPAETEVAQDAPLELDTVYVEDEWEEPEAEISAKRQWRDWTLPSLFAVAIAAWTAFFVWTHSSAMFAGTSAQQWTGWISQWAIPTLLIVAVWLLVMRSSKREAARFGDAAQALSLEAKSLENRLVVVNRELSLAREFLGEQSRELEFLGRSTTERLSTHADELQGLIQSNGAQVEAIASVSERALENMGKLRDDLPVIANSARDVSNRIGGAGREAKGQLDELIAGFERLNEFGEMSEHHVRDVKARVGEALAAFSKQAEELGSIAEARFANMRDQSEEFRKDLAAREIDALAAIRERGSTLTAEIENARALLEEQEEQTLATLKARVSTVSEEGVALSASMREGEEAAKAAWLSQTDSLKQGLVTAVEEIQRIDAQALENAQKKLAALRVEAEKVDGNLANRNRKFLEEMAARQKVFDQAEEEATANMADRLEELDAKIAERREAQLAQLAEMGVQSDSLTARFEGLTSLVESITANAARAETVLDGSTSRLMTKLEESREHVSFAQGSINELTEASVRLLELIQAGSQHSKTELAESMSAADRKLSEIEERGQALKLLLDSTGQQGKALSNYMIRTNDVSAETAKHIEELHSRLSEVNQSHGVELGRLQQTIVELGEQSEKLSTRTQGELREAISQLEDAAKAVSQNLSGATRENIAKLAETVGEESAKAVDRALSEHTKQAIADLETATAKASDVSREAALQLRTQLTKVDELAGNLEARVARARENAEEQSGNDFARRMALITESLNSNAIDISKALASEVPDTTWASYLRGDRGIFTRRAVRLIDNVEARDIAEIYDADPEFRDTVSHYIADFEAMLRTLLSTRDGNNLSVTMLGSDMGKLYVALAQAIERLRD